MVTRRNIWQNPHSTNHSNIKKNMDEKTQAPACSLTWFPLPRPNSGNFMNGKCQAFQSLMNSTCGCGEFILVQ